MKQQKNNSFWAPVKINSVSPVKIKSNNNYNPLFSFPNSNKSIPVKTNLKYNTNFIPKIKNNSNGMFDLKPQKNNKAGPVLNSRFIPKSNFISLPKTNVNFISLPKSNTNFIPKQKQYNNYNNSLGIVKTNINIPKKQMNWVQAKTKFPRLNPFKDADRDGVMNMYDCKPFNKMMQEPNIPNIPKGETRYGANKRIREDKLAAETKLAFEEEKKGVKEAGEKGKEKIKETKRINRAIGRTPIKKITETKEQKHIRELTDSLGRIPNTERKNKNNKSQKNINPLTASTSNPLIPSDSLNPSAKKMSKKYNVGFKEIEDNIQEGNIYRTTREVLVNPNNNQTQVMEQPKFEEAEVVEPEVKGTVSEAFKTNITGAITDIKPLSTTKNSLTSEQRKERYANQINKELIKQNTAEIKKGTQFLKTKEEEMKFLSKQQVGANKLQLAQIRGQTRPMQVKRRGSRKYKDFNPLFAEQVTSNLKQLGLRINAYKEEEKTPKTLEEYNKPYMKTRERLENLKYEYPNKGLFNTEEFSVDGKIVFDMPTKSISKPKMEKTTTKISDKIKGFANKFVPQKYEFKPTSLGKIKNETEGVINLGEKYYANKNTALPFTATNEYLTKEEKEHGEMIKKMKADKSPYEKFQTGGENTNKTLEKLRSLKEPNEKIVKFTTYQMKKDKFDEYKNSIKPKTDIPDFKKEDTEKKYSYKTTDEYDVADSILEKERKKEAKERIKEYKESNRLTKEEEKAGKEIEELLKSEKAKEEKRAIKEEKNIEKQLKEKDLEEKEVKDVYEGAEDDTSYKSSAQKEIDEA